mmetsp:Transcript_49563/g.106067  ORF Transcript_49563/g.106067 Transcript_49563/m.106067 type:complete len:419 (-) Transcript_49563:278-1534(-)
MLRSPASRSTFTFSKRRGRCWKSSCISKGRPALKEARSSCTSGSWKAAATLGSAMGRGCCACGTGSGAKGVTGALGKAFCGGAAPAAAGLAGAGASLPRRSKCVAMRLLNSLRKPVISGSLLYFLLASSGSFCIRLIASCTRGFDIAVMRSGLDWKTCSSVGVTQLLSSCSLLMPCRKACCTSGSFRLSRLAASAESPMPVMKGTSSTLAVSPCFAAGRRFAALPPERKPFFSPPEAARSADLRASSVSCFFSSLAASAFCIIASATSFFSPPSSAATVALSVFNDETAAAVSATLRGTLREASNAGGKSSSSSSSGAGRLPLCTLTGSDAVEASTTVEAEGAWLAWVSLGTLAGLAGLARAASTARGSTVFGVDGLLGASADSLSRATFGEVMVNWRFLREYFAAACSGSNAKPSGT